MPFKKGNRLGFKPKNEEPFDQRPVCFNVRKGVREKLKAVSDWQERLREYVDNLIEEMDKR
jgi:hypothetical protein